MSKKLEKSWDRFFDPERTIKVYERREDGTLAFRKIGIHACHGNSFKTKIAVITTSKADEKKRIDRLKCSGTREGQSCSEIIWKPIEIDYQTNASTVKDKVLAFGYTNLIINLCSEHKLRKQLVNILMADGKFECNITDENVCFEIGALEDSFLPSSCFLMSSTTITDRWEKAFVDLVKNSPISVPNDDTTVVTIISGTHGGKGDRSLVSFKSAFTQKEYLARHFFEQDTKIIARLQRHELTKNMNFHLLNIEDFMVNEEVEATNYKNQSRKLCDQIIESKTTVLVLAWCYSFNGDVCMALRSRGALSRMILEAEMRDIGIENAKLSDNQAELLKLAVREDKKDFFIHGAYGTGKTLLACEIVKIKIAKIYEKQGGRGDNIVLHVDLGSKNNKNLKDSVMKSFSDLDMKSDQVHYQSSSLISQLESKKSSLKKTDKKWWIEKWTTEMIKLLSDYPKPKPKSQKGKEKHHIILMDEFRWQKTEALILLGALHSLPNVSIIIAASVARYLNYNKPKPEELSDNPESHNQIVYQLQHPYRCCRGIATFRAFINEKKDSNLPAITLNLKSLPIPLRQPPVVWMHINLTRKTALKVASTASKRLFDWLKCPQNVDPQKDVMFISHDYEEDYGFPSTFCKLMEGQSTKLTEGQCEGVKSWIFAKTDYVGVDCHVVVVVDTIADILYWDELYSRARELLILVTFDNGMKQCEVESSKAILHEAISQNLVEELIISEEPSPPPPPPIVEGAEAVSSEDEDYSIMILDDDRGKSLSQSLMSLSFE